MRCDSLELTNARSRVTSRPKVVGGHIAGALSAELSQIQGWFEHYRRVGLDILSDRRVHLKTLQVND